MPPIFGEMPNRSEPRFKTNTTASLEMVRDKSRRLSCTITDVSAVGFQISVAQPVSQGEFVRVLVDGQSVISVVRSCAQVGATFTLGLERVDQWATGESWHSLSPSSKATSLKNPVGDLRSAAMQDLFEYREFMGRRIRPRTFSLMLSASAILAMLSVGVAVMPKRKSHTLSIHLNEASWVVGCADGKKVFEGAFPSGADAQLRFASKAAVEARNAAAVSASLGDRHLDHLGVKGTTRWLRVGTENLQVENQPIPASCGTN